MSDKSDAFFVGQGPAVVTTSPNYTNYSTSFITATGEQIGQLSWDDDGLRFSGDVDACADMFAKLWERQLKLNNELRTIFHSPSKRVAEVLFTAEAIAFNGEVDQSARDYFAAVHKRFSGLFKRGAPATPFFQVGGPTPASAMTVSAAPAPTDDRKAMFFRRCGKVIRFRSSKNAFDFKLDEKPRGFESVLEEDRWYRVVYTDNYEAGALENVIDTGEIEVKYHADTDGFDAIPYLSFTAPDGALAEAPASDSVNDLLRFLAVAFGYTREKRHLTLRDLHDFTEENPRFPIRFELLPQHNNCMSAIGPCPQCGFHESVWACVRQWVAVTDAGTDQFNDKSKGSHDIEHEDDDLMECPACHYRGTFKEWEPLE